MAQGKSLTERSKRIFASAGRIDKSNLSSDFDSWPSFASKSWKDCETPVLGKKYDSVLFAGLGGSGIIGEVMLDIAAESDPTFIQVLKDYHLPKYVDSRTLVVGVSSSGSTEETISVIMEAANRGIDVCTFGSGGILETIKNPKVRFTRTSMLKVPRSSFPGLFFPVLKFLTQNGLLTVHEEDVHETIRVMEDCKGSALTTNPRNNEALKLGLFLGEKDVLPLVYSSRRTRAVGLRFRQSLNENSKLHAFDGVVPELCHNEVVAWDAGRASKRKSPKKQSFIPVSLRLEDDPEELKARFDIVEDIARRSKATTFRAPSFGTSYLARIVSMLYLLDYSTYYAAISQEIDPIVTPSIDLLKSELKKRLDYLCRFK